METSEASQKDLSRRQFLNIAIAGIGGLIAALIGIPAIAFLIGPALKQQVEDWIQLGSVKKVETGTPALFKATLKHQTGWVTSEEELAVYILTEDGQNYAALDKVA